MVGPHLLCNVCQVKRPVHLYRVTDTVQVLGCEDWTSGRTHMNSYAPQQTWPRPPLHQLGVNITGFFEVKKSLGR